MRVQQLTEGKIVQAFPLVQFLKPGLSLEDWLQFTAAHLNTEKVGERGILTVEDDRGYIVAMLAYSVDPDLSHGRALVAKDVIAVTSLDKWRKSAISALFGTLEEIAREMRCMAVHTRMSGHEQKSQTDSLHVSLLSSGHAVDHMVLCKTL